MCEIQFWSLRLLRSIALIAGLPGCSAILGVMAGFRVKVNDVKSRFSVFTECETGIQRERGREVRLGSLT